MYKFHVNSFQVVAKSSDRQMKITSIPFEVLLLICEQLDLDSLANLAKTHPYNQRAANYIFEHEFSAEKDVFTVNGYKFHGEQCRLKNPFEFDSMLNTLEIFGQSIIGITIDYTAFNLVQSKRVNEHVSKYVVTSMLVIELMNFHDVQLDGLRGPFERTEFVHLRYGVINSNDIKLNDIFPAVQSLNLNQMFKPYSSAFEHYFPHLVEMETEFVQNKQDLANLKRRLQLNEQLRYLVVKGGNWDFLKMISKHGTHLEYLGFEMFDGTSRFEEEESAFSFFYRLFKGSEPEADIYFENVKDFGISMERAFPNTLERIPIKFGGLERFQCYGSVEMWFDVIIQNQNLKKLTIGELSDEQLHQIADKLPMLEAFCMRYNFQFNDLEKVIGFIEANKKLKRVDFSNGDIEVCNVISQRFGFSWRCELVNEFYVFVKD